MDCAVEAHELGRHAGVGEPGGVQLALVPQRVELGRDHERGGKPSEVVDSER